jgi:hypothetical protein
MLDGARLDVPSVEGGKAGDVGDLSRREPRPAAAGDSPRGAESCAGNVPTSAVVGDGEPEFFCKRPCGILGDLFEGTVLLLCIPPVAVGVAGLGAPFDCLECLEDTDTFLRIPPNFRTLSAPALAFDADLPMVLDVLAGVVGVAAPL